MPEAHQLPEPARGSLQRLLERARHAPGLYPVAGAQGFLQMACLEIGLPCPWEYLTPEQIERLRASLDDFYHEPSRCLHLHALVRHQDGPVPLAPAPASLRPRPEFSAKKSHPALAKNG